MSQNFRIKAQVQKTDLSQPDIVRLYGWAAMSRDDLGRPVVDTDNEHIPIDELERAAQKAFLRRGGKGSVGVMHAAFARADLIESFVLSGEKRESFGLGPGPEGWMVGVESRDPEVIDLVRKGKLLELSIRGQARMSRVRRDVLKNEPTDEVGVMSDLELSDLELLSIVDRGASANERVKSRIVLVKRRKNLTKGCRPMTVQKARTAQAIVAEMLEQGMLTDLSPEDKDTLLSAVSGGMAPMPPSEPEPVESAGMNEEPKAQDMPMDEQKQRDDEAMKRQKDSADVSKLASENAELQKRIRDLEKRDQARELEAVVKSSMAYVPGLSVEQIVKIVQEGRENLSKQCCDDLEKSLKATSEAIRKSMLLGVISEQKDSGLPGAPVDQLRALAKSIKDKEPKMSMADALVAAGKQRPDLWNEYKATR